MLRIGIDISQIVYSTGVSFYTRNLVKNLLKVDKENKYVFYAGTLRNRSVLFKNLEEFSDYKFQFKTKIYPFSPKISDLLFNRFHFVPIDLFMGKLDVFHSSDWTQPKSKAFRVTTIHDLAPIVYPNITERSIVDVHRARLKRIYGEVDRIIVPSDATKNELLRLGFTQDRLRVIHEAPGEVFRPQSEKEVQIIKKKFKIKGKYIFAIGTGKRKNIDGIVRGFDLARAGKNINLVVVGEPEPSLKDKRGVNFIEGAVVDDKILASLYSGAEALIYPSFYEGFGLPILQAFACNCPVVTSNVSSMPEVAGDAAVLVDPKDYNSIAEGILKAISARKGFIKKGQKRVKEFSWEKVAQETLLVYKEAFK